MHARAHIQALHLIGLVRGRHPPFQHPPHPSTNCLIDPEQLNFLSASTSVFCSALRLADLLPPSFSFFKNPFFKNPFFGQSVLLCSPSHGIPVPTNLSFSGLLRFPSTLHFTVIPIISGSTCPLLVHCAFVNSSSVLPGIWNRDRSVSATFQDYLLTGKPEMMMLLPTLTDRMGTTNHIMDCNAQWTLK